MDSQALSKALDASPKVLRTVKANKSPVLLKSDYALNTENYSKIEEKEINRRIKVLDDNPKFIELISLILSDKAKEKMSMDQSELLFEETIYAGGFANETDKGLMKKFHEVDWKGKGEMHLKGKGEADWPTMPHASNVSHASIVPTMSHAEWPGL